MEHGTYWCSAREESAGPLGVNCALRLQDRLARNMSIIRTPVKSNGTWPVICRIIESSDVIRNEVDSNVFEDETIVAGRCGVIHVDRGQALGPGLLDAVPSASYSSYKFCCDLPLSSFAFR